MVLVGVAHFLGCDGVIGVVCGDDYVSYVGAVWVLWDGGIVLSSLGVLHEVGEPGSVAVAEAQ